MMGSVWAGLAAPREHWLLAGWLPLSAAAWAVHMVVYHGAALGFEVMDRRHWLGRFKVRMVERLGYRDMLPRVLANQCFILLPAMLACEGAGLAFVGGRHLGIVTFVASMLLMGVGHDIVQYATHRFLLHGRRLAWLGHGLHHATGASRSLSACYMAPWDFFLEIVCPYLLPLIALGGGGADPVFQLLVPSLGALGGLYEHSGYDLAAPLRALPAGGTPPVPPSIPGPIARLVAALASSHAHGEHHRRVKVSFSDGFGSPGICDWLFGTRWDLVPETARRNARSRGF